MKVLIADDDPVGRVRLAHRLGQDGFSCTAVGDGRTALAHLGAPADRPEIALLDWMMPGLDGVELCGRVRAMAHEPYIYCILLTSRDDREDRLAGLAAGADDYLTKPVDLGELGMRLRTAQRIVELQGKLIDAREQLRVQATTCPLTGLYNRGAILEGMRRELNRAARSGRPVATVMVDIDHFKRVNDTWGHPMGDRVLRRTARALSQVLRPYDLLGRLGGEEFVAFLPECSPAQAQVVAERMRRRVAEQPPLAAEDGHLIQPPTASLGIAAGLADPDDPPSRWLARADRALYLAKGAGRNQVVVEGALAPPRV